MGRYFDRVQTIVDRHGGTTEKFIGDAVVAVFGVPQLHEDDAHRAVRAAVEIRDARAELNGDFQRDWGVELRIRTGVNTGEVVAGDPRGGSGVRLRRRRYGRGASGGGCRSRRNPYRRDDVPSVSRRCHGRAAAPLALKGKAEPVRAWRVREMAPLGPRWARRLDSPLVGRGRELDVLRTVFDRTVEAGNVRLRRSSVWPASGNHA